MTKYGKRLKELREKKGITQDQLAKMLNTSRSRIGMYEQGRRQPDFETQEALADIFNVNMDYLFCKNDSEDMQILIETASKLDNDSFDRLLAYARNLHKSPQQ